MKTLIAIPCMDQVEARFRACLASLEKPGEVTVATQIGSLVYDSRNSLAKTALNANADYVLWLDSDMMFQSDVLKRLLKHAENGLDIVSGLYFRRAAPFTPVLFKELMRDGKPVEAKGFEDYPMDSLFEVDGCGFGCVLMNTDVLVEMALEFNQWFNPTNGFGEDLSFCIRAKALGYKIWCDSSIKLGHVGHLIVDENVYLSANQKG